jgi:hypothetical protein
MRKKSRRVAWLDRGSRFSWNYCQQRGGEFLIILGKGYYTRAFPTPEP